MKRLVLTSLSVILCGLFLSTFDFRLSTVSAQIQQFTGGINVTLNPTNPTPNSNVEVTVQDYLIDTLSANITWIVNGKKVISGIGKNDVNLTAPPLGKVENVSVIISTPDGQTTQKDFVIKSGSVDMITESQGYAPPLYLGKPYFAFQDSVKIVAIPHLANASGKELDPSTLVYRWKQDSTVLQDQNGYGKQSVTITGNVIPRITHIYVTVSTRDGSETADGEVALTPASPSVAFYKDDPLYGVLYNSALGAATTFLDQEITILASPFSFTIPSLTKNDLQYSWNINGQDQPALGKNRSVTLRVQNTGVDASYPVQLNIQNNNQILQGISAGLSVMFKSTKNLSNAPQL
ncbi:MAG: hypothetical protein KGJ35_02250 [Patescibacteria group bacterium]|nr:hypothetical protein [Patescibacteria group bacterium]